MNDILDYFKDMGLRLTYLAFAPLDGGNTEYNRDTMIRVDETTIGRMGQLIEDGAVSTNEVVNHLPDVMSTSMIAHSQTAMIHGFDPVRYSVMFIVERDSAGAIDTEYYQGYTDVANAYNGHIDPDTTIYINSVITTSTVIGVGGKSTKLVDAVKILRSHGTITYESNVDVMNVLRSSDILNRIGAVDARGGTQHRALASSVADAAMTSSVYNEVHGNTLSLVMEAQVASINGGISGGRDTYSSLRSKHSNTSILRFELMNLIRQVTGSDPTEINVGLLDSIFVNRESIMDPIRQYDPNNMRLDTGFGFSNRETIDHITSSLEMVKAREIMKALGSIMSRYFLTELSIGGNSWDGRGLTTSNYETPVEGLYNQEQLLTVLDNELNSLISALASSGGKMRYSLLCRANMQASSTVIIAIAGGDEVRVTFNSMLDGATSQLLGTEDNSEQIATSLINVKQLL